MTDNEITYKIRSAFFAVHAALGPGLFESIYENALKIELEEMGLQVKSQLGVPFRYKGIESDIGFRLDLLVEDRIIVEIKSVESLNEVHFKQIITYLRLTGRKIGLLVNFNVNRLTDKVSVIRVINGY